MKVPFGRIGNKMPIIDDLLVMIPQHDLYVEAFTGSGALFFNKPPVKSILNDNDKEVTYRLNLLKKVPLFKNPKRKYTLDEMKRLFDKPQRSLEDSVIHEKIKSSNGFGGKQVNNSTEIYKHNNPYTIANNLQEYKKLLSYATITNKDYKFILKKYDSPTTFFFLDPPYEDTKRDFYYNVSIDYEEFRDLLKNLKGFFLLTINDSPYIRMVFKDFYQKKITVHSGTNKTTRKELIITNYTF